MDEYFCYPDIVLLDKSNVATGYFPPVENLHRIHHNPLGISFFSVPLFEYQKVVMRLKTIVFDTNKTIVWKMQPPEFKKKTHEVNSLKMSEPGTDKRTQHVEIIHNCQR